jgi:hypothetical protein
MQQVALIVFIAVYFELIVSLFPRAGRPEQVFIALCLFEYLRDGAFLLLAEGGQVGLLFYDGGHVSILYFGVAALRTQLLFLLFVGLEGVDLLLELSQLLFYFLYVALVCGELLKI